MSVLDEMSMTDMSPHAYAKQKGVRCPVCRGEHLDGYDLTMVNTDMVLNQVRCIDCGARWDEEYYLVTYSDLKHKEDEDDVRDSTDGDSLTGY